MPTPPLSLTNLVDITVTVAPAAAVAGGFNQGLFIGPSTVIPSYGTNPRLRQYASSAALLAAGFTTSSPEYIAAEIYFSQTPQPQFIWIGRQDLTALQTIVPDGRYVSDGVMSSVTNPTHLSSATADFVSGDIGATVIVAGAGAAGAALVSTISSVTSTTVAVLAAGASTTVSAAQATIGPLGTGFAVGDLFTVTQGGASYGTGQVLTVGVSGQVLTCQVDPGNQGTGYTVANNLATMAVSPSAGSELEVNITVVGETLLQSATVCRAASNAWYGLVVNNPSLSDNLALAEWADPLWQTTRYYPFSINANIPNGVANNLALQLQALNLRVLGTYATTQGGLYPNNIYAAAGVMGVEMGLTTGLAGSFFNTAYKQIAGIAPEPLTQTQYTNIVAAGWNVYGAFGPYDSYQPGFMSNGAPAYLWSNLAILVANLQLDIMNVLQATPAVSQTNAGQHLFIQAANTACANSASIGFLAPNVWNGAPILGLNTGDALPLGYLNQSPPYSTVSQANIAAGKAPPVYCAITSAGAVQSLVVGVYTQL